MRRLRAAMVPLALWLSGCAGMTESATETFLAAPGKYDLYDCRNIEAELKSVQGRELELRHLMERAAQSSGGDLVNAIAYRSEYLRARGDLRLLNEAAAKKNCAAESRWSSQRAQW